MLEEVHSGSRVDDGMDSWEDILETTRHVAPARDHRVLVQGSGYRAREDGLGQRCEVRKAECRELWDREGLALSLTKCVTLGK